jgi:branched-subunit amino acid transport protein
MKIGEYDVANKFFVAIITGFIYCTSYILPPSHLSSILSNLCACILMAIVIPELMDRS